MKIIPSSLFFLMIFPVISTEGQTFTPGAPSHHTDTLNLQPKNKPLFKKRANDALSQECNLSNECQSIVRADCPVPPGYRCNFVKMHGGQTYTGSDSGILMWDNYSLIRITTDNAHLPENNITALVLDHEDQLWIGTCSSGIVIGKGVDIMPFRILPVQTHDLFIASIFAGSEGFVWVTYRNGGIECFLDGISCKYFQQD